MKEVIIVFSSHRTLESGGVGTHLRHLTTQLKNRKILHEVILGLSKFKIFKLKLFGLFSRIFYAGNSGVNYINNYTFSLYQELQKVLNSYNQPQDYNFIIHCHDKYTALASQYVSKDKYTYKIIQTLHAPFSEQFKITHPNDIVLQNYSRVIDIGLNTQLDNLIAVDRLQSEIAFDLTKYDSDKVSEISNAVDTNQLDSLSYDKPFKILNQIDDYFIVARHLHKKNGILVAIKAFKQFVERNGGKRKLIIMGEGPERDVLTRYVKGNNLENDVYFIGRMPHLESLKIIKNAFASIIPSIPIGIYIEATSLTMLESMYLGVPVVASKIGGLAQVIHDRENGLLFEPGDEQKLVFLLEELNDNSTLYRKISSNSIAKIKSEYSEDKWIQKIIKVYDL